MAPEGVSAVLDLEVATAREVLEVGTRRILYLLECDGASSRRLTLQQFRIVAPGDQPHRFVIHDRDSAFSPAVDAMVTSTGLRVLKTPVRSPQANAYCERLIGTIRRECLDWLIPFSQSAPIIEKAEVRN